LTRIPANEKRLLIELEVIEKVSHKAIATGEETIRITRRIPPA
jgi:hypothetical protein